MVYLLIAWWIFHGYVSHNQMVYLPYIIPHVSPSQPVTSKCQALSGCPSKGIRSLVRKPQTNDTSTPPGFAKQESS